MQNLGHKNQLIKLFIVSVKRLGISHIYVKSHLLNEKGKEMMKRKGAVKGFFMPDATKETKRKTEEVKLTLSCHDTSNSFENNGDDKSRKSKIRNALQKQRERFRLRRNSDKGLYDFSHQPRLIFFSFWFVCIFALHAEI